MSLIMRFGKIMQVSVLAGNLYRPLLAMRCLKSGDDVVDLSPASFSPHRDPLSHRPAPRGLVLHDRVTVAQIATEASQGDLRETTVSALEVVHIGRVRRGGVIAVDTVFGQELPVRGDGIFLRSLQYLKIVFRLIADEIDILFGVAEISLKRHSVIVEADKIEAAIRFRAV